MNFLHFYLPQPILFHLGVINVYWYGFLMALAILAGLLVSVRVAKWHGVDKEIIYDLFFYVVIAGFIGARIFYILYNPEYFWQHPLDIFKIWQGGIAIHGALIFGILAIIWFVRRMPPIETLHCNVSTMKNNFWLLSAIIAPGLALGQAIGRWGNYFNQELFGRPTDLPWGIPIDLINRPAGFEQFTYFHPTFLYESVGDLTIFILLLLTHWFFAHNTRNGERVTSNGQKPLNNHSLITHYSLLITLYLLLYSLLRFMIEFLRIDPTAGSIFGVRATMGLSLLIGVGVLLYWRAIFYLKR
ncbi:MAG: prolipoprotein diacylglyceryl transferase [Patescibacteria group bacterium]